VTILPSDDQNQSGLSDASLREYPNGKYRAFGPSTSGEQALLEHQIDTGVLFGHTNKDVLTEDNYSFSYNSDPARLLYWHIAIRSFDSSHDTALTIAVDIYQQYQFRDLNNLTSAAPS
jgi:hypothetical protein